MWNRESSRKSSFPGGLSGFFNPGLGLFDERCEFFHLRREPADVPIAVVATARLFRTVAAKERPVLRPPIVEPKPVLLHDRLANLLERRIGPRALLIGFTGTIGE